MNLEKRLRALETELTTDALTLTMPDGSTPRLRSHGYIGRLYSGMFGNTDTDPALAGELDLIRRSVDSKEPGGAHMVELLRALLNSPVENPTDAAETIR